MKILYICNEYPPFTHGGIGSFVRDIAEGMIKINNEVEIWGLYDNIDSDIIEIINGVKVYRISYKKTVKRLNYLNFLFKLNYKLLKFINQNNFDIIECQEWQGLLPFGIKHNGYVVRLHGASIFFDNLLKRKKNRLIHFFEKLTLYNSKNLVAVSDYCGKITLELCNLKKKYTVIYNAVNIKKIYKFKEDVFDEYSILFVNSLLPKKGIFELARSYNEIAEQFPNSKLIFIGKTSYYKNNINVKELILDLIDDKFKNNVKILGWLESPEDVYKYISKAHVCCYPSHMEGFGIAPVEAMALGKVVIFMKDGPGSEVIENGKSGILVDTKDSKNIANEIINIFNKRYNLLEIGNEAKDRANKLFDLENVFIPINIKYYESIIENNNK